MHSVHLSERKKDGMPLPKVRNTSSYKDSVDRQRYAPKILSDMQALLQFH
jgi:hypothetical protein